MGDRQNYFRALLVSLLQILKRTTHASMDPLGTIQTAPVQVILSSRRPGFTYNPCRVLPANQAKSEWSRGEFEPLTSAVQNQSSNITRVCRCSKTRAKRYILCANI